MRQVRIGTFETNSSSTHTLVIMTKEQYEKFKNGELFVMNDKPITKEEVAAKYKDTIEKYHEGNVEDFLSDESGTFDAFFDNNSGYEDFYQEYETPSGEKIVAFGYYGYNG